MPRWPSFVALVLAAGAMVALPASVSAQAGVGDTEPLVPIWLARPEYPAIAKAARIQGNVAIAIEVSATGDVASTTVLQGHATLVQAAVAAARESHFAGRRAGALPATYTLTYSFALDAPPRPAAVGETAARMTTVESTPFAIFHYSDVTVRGAKCLYLWRCGQEWGGYAGNGYGRVHAAKCLWLWKCDWGKPFQWE